MHLHICKRCGITWCVCVQRDSGIYGCHLTSALPCQRCLWRSTRETASCTLHTHRYSNINAMLAAASCAKCYAVLRCRVRKSPCNTEGCVYILHTASWDLQALLLRQCKLIQDVISAWKCSNCFIIIIIIVVVVVIIVIVVVVLQRLSSSVN